MFMYEVLMNTKHTENSSKTSSCNACHPITNNFWYFFFWCFCYICRPSFNVFSNEVIYFLKYKEDKNINLYIWFFDKQINKYTYKIILKNHRISICADKLTITSRPVKLTWFFDSKLHKGFLAWQPFRTITFDRI